MMYVARLVCDEGFIPWGQSSMSCQEGAWSSPPASCRPLSCGFPPRVEKAKARLENGTTLWNDEAVYDCEPGYLMVVNDSSAQDYARVTCSIQGEWTTTSSIKCVDASQLDGFLSGSARVSINIIYSLLALLIIFSIPLLVFYCCSRRRQNQKKKKSGRDRSEKTLKETDSESPRAGIYSVSAGQILQPATISPSTLRSLSSGSNSFKPFSPPGQASQPSSLPYNTWQSPDKRLTKTSLPFQFESPILTAPSTRSTLVVEEPIIDEAGYASLIAKQDPLYEPLRETKGQVEVRKEEEEGSSSSSTGHTYDDVPIREPEYANMIFYPGQGPSSYPDLLEMVRRSSKTPSPVLTKEVEEEEEESHSHLYAKVDLSRKRSRPSSTESQETVISSAAASNSDSYTKTLIEKFNQFLEQSGHVSVSNNYKNTPDKRLTSQH